MAGVQHELCFQTKLTPGKLVAEKSLLERAPIAKHCILRHVDMAEASSADVTLHQITPTDQETRIECRRLSGQWLRGGRGYRWLCRLIPDPSSLPSPLLPVGHQSWGATSVPMCTSLAGLNSSTPQPCLR